MSNTTTINQNSAPVYNLKAVVMETGLKPPTIRAWERAGLIRPVRKIYRLPYFDFQQVASARQLVKMLASGMSPAAIERKLEQVAQLVPDVASPLEQLSVIVEGKDLLLRQGEGLIDSAGQMRIDFRDGAVTLNEGEMLIVPSGVEHKPFAESECHVMVLVREGTVNTGDAPKNELTTDPQARI